MVNIALVVLDTLRADTFERYFDWIPGRHFTTAYSTSHWTIPAHGSLFTGKYPSEIGVHAKSQTLDCPEQTLAEALQEEGYTTRFWCANHNLAFWDGWDRGFNSFITPSALDPNFEEGVNWSAFLNETDTHSWMKYPKAVLHAVMADCSTTTALQQGYKRMSRSDADGGAKDTFARLQTTDFKQNEFLAINLMETHTPYHPPDGTNSGPVNVVIGDAFSENVGDERLIRRAYNASAAILAKIYREIFHLLQDDFDYVFTISDHGELLGEHGLWNHGYGLSPELTHIPVVVSGTGIDDEADDKPVSILDVHQTIAELTHTDIDSRGQDLLGNTTARTRLTEFHGFVPSHFEQFDRKGVPPEFYEKRDSPLQGLLLPDGEYVYESHSSSIQGGDEGKTAQYRDEINSLKDSLNQRSVTESTTDMDESVKQRLRDLGYA